MSWPGLVTLVPGVHEVSGFLKSGRIRAGRVTGGRGLVKEYRLLRDEKEYSWCQNNLRPGSFLVAHRRLRKISQPALALQGPSLPICRAPLLSFDGCGRAQNLRQIHARKSAAVLRDVHPTDGSRWRVRSSLQNDYTYLKIPPMAVGGWFRSSLQNDYTYLKIPPTAVGGWFRSFRGRLERI